MKLSITVSKSEMSNFLRKLTWTMQKTVTNNNPNLAIAIIYLILLEYEKECTDFDEWNTQENRFEVVLTLQRLAIDWTVWV